MMQYTMATFGHRQGNGMRRYVSITLGGEDVYCWERGLLILVYLIAREMKWNHLGSWPELAHAEKVDQHGCWRLIFVWPEQV
jgi:hypothetical protein